MEDTTRNHLAAAGEIKDERSKFTEEADLKFPVEATNDTQKPLEATDDDIDVHNKLPEVAAGGRGEVKDDTSKLAGQLEDLNVAVQATDDGKKQDSDTSRGVAAEVQGSMQDVGVRQNLRSVGSLTLLPMFPKQDTSLPAKSHIPTEGSYQALQFSRSKITDKERELEEKQKKVEQERENLQWIREELLKEQTQLEDSIQVLELKRQLSDKEVAVRALKQKVRELERELEAEKLKAQNSRRVSEVDDEVTLEDPSKTGTDKVVYKKSDCIAEGRFAFVYEGKFKSSGAPVAIKRIVSKDKNFQQEIDMLQKAGGCDFVVQHKFTVEACSDVYYIVLELADTSLYRFFTEQEYEELRNSWGIFRKRSVYRDILHQAVKGVAHLNSLKIIHRDIKPHNVLLWIKNDGVIRAKITDFGLAKKAANDSASTSQHRASRGWAASEIIGGEGKYTNKVDIFGLGCVMYFVLTEGKHPFDGDKPFMRDANIMNDAYNLDALSEQDLELIKRMISKESAHRPGVEYVKAHCFFFKEEEQKAFFSRVCLLLKESSEVNFLSTDSEVFQNHWTDLVLESVCDQKMRKNDPEYGSSVYHLIRALRNKMEHCDQQLLEEVKRSISNASGIRIDDVDADALKKNEAARDITVLRYFTSLFPKLLVHTWIKMKNYRHEDDLKDYYPSEMDDVVNP